MVQQLVDKASQYRLVSNRSAMPAGDKQHPIAVKKVALRELPNEIGNVINRSGNSQLVNDKKPAPDSVKVVGPDVKVAGTGIKRQHPDGPSSPSNYQTPGKVGPNTSIVYVRRKLEVDHSSARTAATVNDAKFQEAKKNSCNRTKEDSEQGQNQEPNEASPPAYVPVTVASLAASPGAALGSQSLGKPCPGLAAPDHETRVTPSHDSAGAYFPGDTHRAIGQNWKDRFFQLQLFLQSCDQLCQEDYIQKLRSLSAIGRSRHAVELEKRAIHLLLEEGKELHRMRLLNVLGKGSPRDQASVPTQTSPAQFQS